jgi:hypothetical protein
LGQVQDSGVKEKRVMRPIKTSAAIGGTPPES